MKWCSRGAGNFVSDPDAGNPNWKEFPVNPKGSVVGFTLLELLVVLAVMATLFALAVPSYTQWIGEANSRKAARDVASVLRSARAQAISKDQEYSVAFDLDSNRYRILQGDGASGTPITEWISYPAEVDMGRGGDCDTTAGDGSPDWDNVLNFNPNGTAGGYPSQYICILDSDTDRPTFKAGVYSSTTGRIVIEKRTPDNSGWE